MSLINKFELIESSLEMGNFQLVNHQRGECSSLKLRSLGQIKRKFKHYICSETNFFFQHLGIEAANEIKQMLPRHRLLIEI